MTFKIYYILVVVSICFINLIESNRKEKHLKCEFNNYLIILITNKGLSSLSKYL